MIMIFASIDSLHFYDDFWTQEGFNRSGRKRHNQIPELRVNL